MTSPSEPLYVLVWRELDSWRLRTYTSSDNRPLASPLKNVFPRNVKIIDKEAELNNWLESGVNDQETVAVSIDLARSELGWDPQEPTVLSSEDVK
jgi:hypothetical protein